MSKRKTPYQMLLEDIQDFVRKVKYPERELMWEYPKDRLAEGWRLTDLSERVRAAAQLGYDVVIVPTDNGLRVEYRKRPVLPYSWDV